RDFTALMESHEDGRGPINLGNPEDYQALQLTQKLLERTGSRSHLPFQDLPQDEPVRRCPDIQRARDLLQWTPQTGLEEGLNQSIDYFQQVLRDGSKKAKPTREQPILLGSDIA